MSNNEHKRFRIEMKTISIIQDCQFAKLFMKLEN